MVYTIAWQGGMEKKSRKKRIVAARGKGRDAGSLPQTERGLKKASLFMNGRSQAVRLPKEFRFEGDHVFAMKDGDRVVLMPKDDRMERLLRAFGSAPDFPDREQGPPQERPELDELFK